MQKRITALLTIWLLVGLVGCAGPDPKSTTTAVEEPAATGSQWQEPDPPTAPSAPSRDQTDDEPYYHFPPQTQFYCYLDSTLLIDLNGDGHEDTIHYSRNEVDGVIVKVNDRSNNCEGMSECEKFIQVVDLDTSDPYKEIAVYDDGPSGDPCFTFLWYDGSKLSVCGEVRGCWEQLRFHGDGRLTSSGFRGLLLCTWWYEATLFMNEQHVLAEPPGQLREMRAYSNQEDGRLTVATPFVLRQSRKDDSPIVTVLKPGDSLKLLVTDDVRWIQAETQNGLRGWFALEGYCTIIGLTPDKPGELTGMNCAD